MLQRTALLSRENGRVQQSRHFLDFTLRRLQAPGIVEVLTQQDDTTARTAQGLVGRRGYDVSPFHGVLQQSGSNQTGGVSHVDHQQGSHLVGNLAHALVVPFAAVGRATADNQLRLVLDGQLLHLVIVHAACLLVQVVAHGLVQDTARVHQRTV